MRAKGLFNLSIDSSRIYGLDILRSLAILFVIFSHYRHCIDKYINEKIYMMFIIDGVELFFALSGFLIGGMLIRNLIKKEFSLNSLLSFFQRRYLRTMPAYFFIVISLLILDYLYLGAIQENSIYFVFFIQNFFTSVPSNFFPEAWSLSVEIWFYFIFPTLVFLLSFLRCKTKIVLAIVIIFLIIGTTIFRTILAYHLNCQDQMCWILNIRQPVIARLDALIYGVAAAFIQIYYPSIFNKNKNQYFIIGILLLILHPLYDFFIGDLFYKKYLTLTISSLGAVLLLPKLAGIQTGKGVLYNFFTKISMVSYSMYLLHFSIMYVYGWRFIVKISPFLGSESLLNGLAKFLILFFLTYLFAVLMYKYIELPFMKLRNKNGR